jgi:lysophospholipase L1-like esterase
MSTPLRILELLVSLLVAQGAGAADDFSLKDGDVVVMLGDSITEQRLYSNYLELWARTRFPHWRLTFYNVGVGGDTSYGANYRFPRDVARLRPTVVTVMLGMNDGRYQPFDQGRFDGYVKGLQGIADQAKAIGSRVVWLTTQAVDDAAPGRSALEATLYNKTLERFAEAGVKAIAKKNGGRYIDLFHPHLALLDRARSKPGKYVPITGTDAVHAGPPGQAAMAAAILEGLQFPTLIAAVEIDAGWKTAAGKHAKVTAVAVKDGVVSFQQLDAALPFFPPEAAGILEWSPLCASLNRYELKVLGLAAGRYEVRLDGKAIATHTGAELGAGVNLAMAALRTGPIADQVKAVVEAVNRRNEYFFTQAHLVLRPKQLPIDAATEALYEKRMAKMPELDRAVRAALQIKAHTVEVVPVK